MSSTPEPFSFTVFFWSVLPTLLNTTSKSPVPFTSWLKRPSASVKNMATAFVFCPALNTRTVAKASPSFKLLSISTPFTVVCAITADETIISVINKNTFTFFIPLFVFLIFCCKSNIKV